MENGQHLLLADEPDIFAQAVVLLLQDISLRQQLAANARRLVKTRHNWQQIGPRFVRLVEETVVQKRQVAK